MWKDKVRYAFHSVIIVGMRIIAPLTHFIPEEVRHQFVRKVMRTLEDSTLDQMAFAPWERGLFPNGANLMGYFHAGIGLGQGARMYAQALEDTGLPFQLVDVPLPDAPPPPEDEYSRAVGAEPVYAVNISHINPDMLSYVLANTPSRFWDKRYNIGVWLWELEKLPPEWVKRLSFYDEIWAPSRFIAQAVRKETEKPVRVIPYGVAEEKPTCGRERFGLPEDAFLVLAMYDTQSYAQRKNPMGAVEAFVRAFGRDHPRARLVLKMNNPREEDIRRLRETQGGEKMILLTEHLERSEVISLVAAADVFISLHRSEGFGLVIAEAMSQRVPVVATNYSANTDFMDETCACPVRYTPVDVNGAYMYGQKGVCWAEPDVDQAAEYLRRLYEDEPLRRRIGEAGYRRISEGFVVARSAQAMRERLEEILRGNTAAQQAGEDAQANRGN